jgi:hypothetical protein
MELLAVVIQGEGFESDPVAQRDASFEGWKAGLWRTLRMALVKCSSHAR